MGFKQPRCRDCEVDMVKGVVLDRAHGGVTVSSMFADGSPPQLKFLGLPMGLNPEKSSLHEIEGFRCPNCGFLALYAR